MSCIICTYKDGKSEGNPLNKQYINCPRCGEITIAPNVMSIIKNDTHRILLSRKCRELANSNENITIDKDIAIGLLTLALPSVKEQIDLLICYYGNKSRGNPRYKLDINDEVALELAAELMLPLESDLEKIKGNIQLILNVYCSKDTNDLYFIGSPGTSRTMTHNGWERHYELTSERSDKKKQAFFALEFPKEEHSPDIKKMYSEIEKKSRSELGIHIMNPLLNEPKGGLIHVRMEVEIRKSLFLVADLSHGNQGVYWESGFAHGLGIPVFYLCHSSTNSTNKDGTVHFDTGPYYRIEWNDDTIDEAIKNLFNSIRATLPGKVL